MRFNGHRQGRFTKANASRLGRLGVEARVRKRLERTSDDALRRVEDGQWLGVLQWQAADGTVRRWRIAQGPRANNIRVMSKGKEVVCGWDWLMASLRKRLAVPKRVVAEVEKVNANLEELRKL